MKVIQFPEISSEFITSEKNTIVFGGFDSMHIGHLELFKKALAENKNAIVSIVQNIENSPKNTDNKTIFSLRNRLDILNAIEIQNVLLIKLDEKLINLEPWDFIDEITKKYKIEKIVVGEDYKFGKDAKWNAKNLKEYFPNTIIVPLIKIGNYKIGTKLISEMIKTGEVSDLNSLLIKFFSIDIDLVSSLEFQYPKKIIKIHNGIYACLVYINNVIYHATVLIDVENKNIIKFFNYNYEKPQNNIRISFIQEIRIITKKSDSKIFSEDEKTSKIFLLNYAKINSNSDLIW
ncbi:FAD synthase [[Mycoplasma] mobile]|uniref:FAD synthase n=1 Tax=Mycoplasma mobile (strain ATCC 43663 / 163K / NCTC 11711) TaxID=267748 RepID=Q6KHH6_MYCM1|nr:adenylyltransferase/cytidyltransferase family protein [[Mycoplasma] mobile]AAT27954.1 FAD synthase (riboflavin kinase/biosynthesis protein) [Mycoplasma mobile 163K]